MLEGSWRALSTRRREATLTRSSCRPRVSRKRDVKGLILRLSMLQLLQLGNFSEIVNFEDWMTGMDGHPASIEGVYEEA